MLITYKLVPILDKGEGVKNIRIFCHIWMLPYDGACISSHGNNLVSMHQEFSVLTRFLIKNYQQGDAEMQLAQGASIYDVRTHTRGGEGSWKRVRSKGGCVNFRV